MVCVDLDGGRAKETVAMIEETGGNAFPVTADVSTEGDVVAMLDAAVEKFGPLDVLYNNVGIPTPRLGMTMEDHTWEDFQKLVAVNLGASSLLKVRGAAIQGAGHWWRHPEHRVSGRVGGLGWSRLRGHQGGVHQLTKAIAVEAAPFGIRVNAICPAAMPFTGFMAAGGMDLPPEAMQQVGEAAGAGHPLGKPITAEDCAQAAVFLCSDEAVNITGVLLPVDGGYVAK